VCFISVENTSLARSGDRPERSFLPAGAGLPTAPNSFETHPNEITIAFIISQIPGEFVTKRLQFNHCGTVGVEIGGLTTPYPRAILFVKCNVTTRTRHSDLQPEPQRGRDEESRFRSLPFCRLLHSLLGLVLSGRVLLLETSVCILDFGQISHDFPKAFGKVISNIQNPDALWLR